VETAYVSRATVKVGRLAANILVVIRPHRTQRIDTECCEPCCALSGVCVCVLGTRVNCAKAAEPIVSRSGGQTLMGPRDRVLSGNVH